MTSFQNKQESYLKKISSIVQFKKSSIVQFQYPWVITHFLSKVFTFIAFLKDGACHRKVPHPSKCLFQISSSLQKKTKRERNVFPFVPQNAYIFSKAFVSLSFQACIIPVLSKYLYTKILSLFFGFSSPLDSPKLCHQHSLGIHNLVTSHASSCKFSQNFMVESFIP